MVIAWQRSHDISPPYMCLHAYKRPWANEINLKLTKTNLLLKTTLLHPFIYVLYASVHVEFRGQLSESVLSFPPHDPGDGTQVYRLGGRHLYRLSHTPCPSLIFIIPMWWLFHSTGNLAGNSSLYYFKDVTPLSSYITSEYLLLLLLHPLCHHHHLRLLHRGVQVKGQGYLHPQC